MTSGVAEHRATAALLDEITGLHPRRTFLSSGSVRRLAKLNDLAGGRLGAVPQARRLDFILSSALSVDTSETERVLGLAFRPLRETVSDAIRWWAANGTIKPDLAGRLGASPIPSTRSAV